MVSVVLGPGEAHETARIHHPSWRRGSRMAARSSGAAASEFPCRISVFWFAPGGGVDTGQRSAKPEQNRLWGPERGDRISLELGNAGLKLIGKRR